MGFILTGFRQEMGFRVFAFERREAAKSRMAFTVRADLALIRRYDIRVQELPLLCRSLLDRREAASAASDGASHAATAGNAETRASGGNGAEARGLSGNSADTRALTFTEDEMRACANDRNAARVEAARKRKPPRRPTGETPGAAWRG